MRWDTLFDELRAHEEDRRALTRESEAHELAQGTWSERRWADALAEREVEIRLVADLRLQGRVTALGAGWLAVDTGRDDVIVARDHVVEVLLRRPDDQTWPDGDAEDSIALRLGWGYVFRAVAATGETVTFTRIDGSTMAGLVDVVGRDFVRARIAGTLRLIPFSSLVAVRLPR